MFNGFNAGNAGKADPATAEVRAALQTVRGYWEALRPAGGGVPRRADIQPKGLSHCLEKVFLIERIAPGHARFRLAGMHLMDLMGMEVRGMPLTALFAPEARARVAEDLEQVFAAPAILQISLEAERGMGRSALSGQMLVLPLRGDADEPGLALGCLATLGSIGRTPRRFAVSGMLRELIAPVPATLRAVPQATPAAPVPPTRVLAPRPWLRLVSSMG